MFVTIREVDVDDLARRRRYGAAPLPAASTWRWLALVAATAAFAHHWLAAATDPLASLLAATGAPLARGSAVVAGWTPVLLALVGYAAVALRPAHRRAEIHDRLARHVVGVSVLASLQVGATDDLLSTAALWTLLAVIAVDAYLAIANTVGAGRVGRAIAGPFAALAGFATLVAVLAIDAALADAGLAGEAPAVVLVLVLAAAAIRRGVRHADPVLPAVIAAGLVVVSEGATGAAGAAAFAIGAVATASVIVIIASLGVRPAAPVAARPRATRATPFADAIAHDRFARGPTNENATADDADPVVDLRRAA